MTTIHNNFTNLFSSKISHIPKDWKLLYLGTSCHTTRIRNKFRYFQNFVRSSGSIPGAFSLGIDSSIIPILIKLLKKTNQAWDIGPLKYINTHFHNECYIIYPYLTIADVTDSDIRKSKTMLETARKCQWKLEDYKITFKYGITFFSTAIDSDSIQNKIKLNVNFKKK